MNDLTPVSRDTTVRLAAYLGVLCAYLAAVDREPLLALQLSLLAVAAGWSLLFERRFPRLFLPPAAKIVLITAGALLFLGLLVRSFGGAPAEISSQISRFLFWNAIVFVLSRAKTEYDLWTLAIIDLSLFMISGAFVQPARFLPLFALSLLANLVVFAKLSLLRCGPAGQAERRGPLVALFQFALALEIGALVFFFFPRRLFPVDPGSPLAVRADEGKPRPVPTPPEGTPVASEDTGRTGVPRQHDYLSLTQFASIKIDRRPILTLELLDPREAPPPDRLRYLRGAVLDRYERGAWTARFSKRPVAGTADSWTELPAPWFPSGPRVEQRIRLEPLSSGLLFALAEPTHVRIPNAEYDSGGILFLPAPAKETIQYDVASRLAPETDLSRIRDVASPARYVELPPGLESLRRMSARATEGRGTMRAKMDALVAVLRDGGYAYKLAAFSSPDGMDPAEHFLLRRKEGSCVHFATALALLARASGIPCRLATGFHLQEYDAAARRFLVRNSDAHAWVEVDFGDAGWIVYDPTPAESALPPPGDPVASGTKPDPKEGVKSGTAGPSRWDRFLVEYGAGDQGALTRLASAAGSACGRLVRGRIFWILAGSAVLAVAGVYLLLPARSRRLLRQLLEGTAGSSSVDFYRDLLWILGRRGLRKAPGQTGWEFARSCGLEGVEYVTERFYRVCYAGGRVTDEERREIERILKRLAAKRPVFTPSGSA